MNKTKAGQLLIDVPAVCWFTLPLRLGHAQGFLRTRGDASGAPDVPMLLSDVQGGRPLPLPFRDSACRGAPRFPL